MGRIIRVFPRKTNMSPTDDLAYFDGPPLPGIQPEADEVHVSVTFTQDVEQGKRLAEAWSEFYPTKLGGPAWNDAGGEFEPGMYVKKGITFTTRGCPKECPWCYVWKREGELRCLEVKPGHIVQDNNLVAAPWEHLDKVFAMLRDQRMPIQFAGGIDPDRVCWKLIDDYLKSVKIGGVWVSCDSGKKGDMFGAKRAIWMLSKRGLSRRQIRCYVLIGYEGEAADEARARLEEVWKYGALPFAMLYDRTPRTREWAELQREWTRPAAMFATHKSAE